MIRTVDSILKNKLFLWVRLGQFAVALAVFTYAALVPAKYIATGYSDHLLHFVGNVLLFLSASIACYGRMKLRILIILLIPYSLMIELSQWLAPSRHLDTYDMLVNFAGLLTGFAVAFLCEWGWSRISEPVLLQQK